MNDPLRTFIKRHPLLAYFVLAYAISWAIEIPLALSARGILKLPIPLALYYPASFGPLAAALIVTGWIDGRAGLRSLVEGLLKWRVKPVLFIFSAFSPIVMFAVSVLVGRLTAGSWPDLRLLGQVDYLPYLGTAGSMALWFVTYGLGEETGWRGFALPRLQKNKSALTATLILGVLWAFWHLPLFFFKGSFAAMGLAGFPMFLLSMVCASVIFTWIYNGTRGSILMVALFHAMFDFFSSSKAGGDSAAIIMSVAATVWAVLVMVLFKPATLSRAEKQDVDRLSTHENQAKAANS